MAKTLYPDYVPPASDDTSDVSRHSSPEDKGYISIVEISDSDKERMENETNTDDIPVLPEADAQTSADEAEKDQQNAHILADCGINMDHPQYSELLRLDFSKCVDQDDHRFIIAIAPQMLCQNNVVYTTPPNITRETASEIFNSTLRGYNTARDNVIKYAKEWNSTIDVYQAAADKHDKTKDNIQHPLFNLVQNAMIQLDNKTRLLASQIYFTTLQLDILAEQIEHLSLWMIANKESQYKIVPHHFDYIASRLRQWKHSREDFIPPSQMFHAPAYSSKLQEQLKTYLQILNDNDIPVAPEFKTNRFNLHIAHDETSKQQFYALTQQRNRPEYTYMSANDSAPMQQEQQQYQPEQYEQRFSPDDTLYLTDEETYRDLNSEVNSKGSQQGAAFVNHNNVSSISLQDISELSDEDLYNYVQHAEARTSDVQQPPACAPAPTAQPNKELLQWFINNHDNDIDESIINKLFGQPQNCSLCEQTESKTASTQTENNALAEGQPILLLVSNQRNIKIIEPHIKENMTIEKIHLNKICERKSPNIYFPSGDYDNIAKSASFMMNIVQRMLTSGKSVNIWIENYGQHKQGKLMRYNPTVQLAEQEETWQYMDTHFDSMDMNQMMAAMMLAARLSLQIASLCMAKKPVLLHPDANTVCSVRTIWPTILNPEEWNVSKKCKARKLKKK